MCVSSIRFNSVKQARSDIHVRHSMRHSTKNEPPLPVSIGMVVYAKTRKKSLVNKLCKEGISVSYVRVKQIETSIANQLCRKYHEDEIVCPATLQQTLFTMAAIDNIDHNPSSNTATTSFHGTSISVFQIPETPVQIDSFRLEESTNDLSRALLPSSYTEIRPTGACKSNPPLVEGEHRHTDNTATSVYTSAIEWLERMSSDSTLKRYHFNVDRLPGASSKKKFKQEAPHLPEVASAASRCSGYGADPQAGTKSQFRSHIMWTPPNRKEVFLSWVIDAPDTVTQHLMRSGDVQSNPGPVARSGTKEIQEEAEKIHCNTTRSEEEGIPSEAARPLKSNKTNKTKKGKNANPTRRTSKRIEERKKKDAEVLTTEPVTQEENPVKNTSPAT